MAKGTVGDDGQPGASAKELWDENQKLKRENAYLKRQREILKKAASILAEDPQLGMR
jgi:transposase-like protein